jgi:hypothetical protein
MRAAVHQVLGYPEVRCPEIEERQYPPVPAGGERQIISVYDGVIVKYLIDH